MRLLLAIARRQSTLSSKRPVFKRSFFIVTTTTAAALFSSTCSMSHAEKPPPQIPTHSSYSLTSAALELSGAALSLLGNTLNEIGDAAKQSASSTVESGRKDVYKENDKSYFSSSSSSSSPHQSTSPALPRDVGFQLTIGSVCGFCSGYALKKVGKTAAFVFGIGFISLQAIRIAQIQNLLQSSPSSIHASSTSVSTPSSMIDWEKAEAEMIKFLDADKDGKVTLSDLQTISSRLVSSLSLGLPSSGAFAAAFFLGLRWG